MNDGETHYPRDKQRSQFNQGLVSCQTVEWGTPQGLFDYWNRIFAFTLDAAAQPENAKCERYFTPKCDGLSQSWAGERVWLNPPYGRGIERWITKAKSEAENGALCVLLLKHASDTRWWDLIDGPHTTVRRLKGRVRHNDQGPAPFPSVVVIFWPYGGFPKEQR